MEKQVIGNRLVLVGLILYISSIFFLVIIAIFWSRLRYVYLIVCILTILGLINIVIGSLMRKKDVGYWLVLIGVIMLLGVIFLNALAFIERGILMVVYTYSYPFLIIFSLIFIVAGGLTKEKRNKSP